MTTSSGVMHTVGEVGGFIAEHKLLLAGVAGIAVVIYLLSSNGSSTATAPGYSTADIQASEALQAAQLQASSNANNNATALAATQEQSAAAIQLAQIQAATTVNANTLSAQVASLQINQQAAVAENHDTLSAQVAENTNATQVQLANISTQGQIAQTQTLTDALIRQTDIQAQSNQAIAKIQADSYVQAMGDQLQAALNTVNQISQTQRAQIGANEMTQIAAINASSSCFIFC